MGTITATSGSLPWATTQSRGVVRVQLLTSVTSSETASRRLAARNGTASHRAWGFACATANGSHSANAATTSGQQEAEAHAQPPRACRRRRARHAGRGAGGMPAGVLRKTRTRPVQVTKRRSRPRRGDRRAGGEDAPEGPAGRDLAAQRRRPLPGALGRDEPVEAADREVGLPVGQAIGVDDGPRVAELARRVEPAGEGPRVVDEVALAGPGVRGDVARGRVHVDPGAVDALGLRDAEGPAAPTTSVARTTPGRPRGTRLSSRPASGRVNRAPKTACLLSPTELAVTRW